MPSQYQHNYHPPTQRIKLNNEKPCCSCSRYATCCKRSPKCECRFSNSPCTNCTPNNHCQNRSSLTTALPTEKPTNAQHTFQPLNHNKSKLNLKTPPTPIPTKPIPNSNIKNTQNPYLQPNTTIFHNLENEPPPNLNQPPFSFLKNRNKGKQSQQQQQQQQQLNIVNKTISTTNNTTPPTVPNDPIIPTQTNFDLINEIDRYPYLDTETSLDLQTQEKHLIDKKIIDIYNDTIH